jgi:hypothetical protein
MAWQLIYTSAPRLLEAGRSGFGSVARHRQISPLLVSAIERASQFSRQPGMDPGRVIFSHRMIPISGGRFHVLSCIRDAGADYTGRTNHIAHHVIAEAREVAQLGAQGASPADVLLTMAWVAKWDEPPLYFETADEVHLANFAPQTAADGAHWAPVTGSAAHAWLLATGEASRGAYVIPPPRVDLRWLFADSLRLAPERLWQIAFTTSLQSKDEISDYRWIGLDADSPLRTETGASGRAVLDLTQPHLLPVPEPASNPPAAHPADAKMPVTAGAGGNLLSSGSGRYATQSIPAAPELVASRPPSPRVENLPTFAPSTARRRLPVWIIWTLAAVLAVIGLVFGVYLPWARLADLRRQIARTLKWSDYFSDQSLDPIARNLLPDSKSWPDAEETAKALNRIATALMHGQLEDITPDDERQLHALTGRRDPPPLPDLTRLQSLLEAARERNQWKPALKFAKEAVQLQQTTSDEINSAIPSPPYDKLNKALRARADRRIAEAEYDLLAHHRSIQPPESIAVFKKSLLELKTRMTPGNDQALNFIAKADAIVALWELTESTSSSASEKIAAIRKSDGENAAKWPAWLLKKVIAQIGTYEDKFVSTSPAAARNRSVAPSVPLYVVSDAASLKDANFHELRGKLTYFLQSPANGERRQLRDPGNEGKLRLNISEDPLFLVNEAISQITPERGAEALPTPFILIAQDSSDHDVIQIWVAAGSDKPFYPDRKTSMTRAANLLSVNLDDLSLPGVFQTPLRLRLPDEYDASGKSNGSLPLVDGKADLGGLLREAAEKREAKEKEIENLKRALTLRNEDPKADFANRKYLVIQAARLDDELRKKDSQASKDLGKDSAPPVQQCGNLIVAITRPAQFSGADKLFEIGSQLSKLSPDKDESLKGELLSAASANTALAITTLSEELQKVRASQPRSQEEMGLRDQEVERLKRNKDRYEPTLLRLKEVIDSLLPETSQAKAAREIAEGQLREKLKSAGKELEQISADPLLSLPRDSAPAGTYRLMARTAQGGEALLLKLDVAP